MATGREQEFDYGLQINNNVKNDTATRVIVSGADGVLGYQETENLKLTIIPATTHYIPTTETLKGHFQGVDEALGNIVQTTAGITSRVFYTGDLITLGAGTFYQSSYGGKGTVPNAAPTPLSVDDNEKKYFAQDVISTPFTMPVIAPAGAYSGNLSVRAANSNAQQRYTIEIYRTNLSGTPIPSGVAGAPTGNLGVTVISILDSGLLDLAGGDVTNITLSGYLTQEITFNLDERIRYRVSAAKVGTVGGAVTMEVFYGSDHNSYYDVPVLVDTNSVLNRSTVVGASTTNALDTLNTGKEDLSNKSNGTLTTSATTYPTSGAVKSAVDAKQNLLTNPITGTGTVNKIPKWTGTTTQGDSNITDSGTLVTVGSDMLVNGMTVGNRGVTTSTMIGTNAGAVSSGANIIAIGFNSLLASTTASNTVAIGRNAMFSTTNGSTSVAVGAFTLSSNITGNNNNAIGHNALFSNLASQNTAIGTNASYNNTTGTGNLSIGNFSLEGNTTGSNNSAIGSGAGRYIADGVTIATNVSSSIFIGGLSKPLADSQVNQIVVGYNSIGLGSNTNVIGNSSSVFSRIWGRLLLGTSTDNGTDALQVSGSMVATTIKKSGGTSSQFLKADGSVDSTAYAPLASPTFSGVPTAPTATAGTNTTQVATTAFVMANAGTAPTGLTVGFLSKWGGTNFIDSSIESTSLTPIKIGTRFVVNNVADNSNFLGVEAGNLATLANNSNFLGTRAGYMATNAQYSNFIGVYAGNEATDAYQSNFFGLQSGYKATNAYSSNFIGDGSGFQAADASDSNFIGRTAGYNATNAHTSNFIGNGTGTDASFANNSNFLGYSTGKNATFARDSNFMGQWAGAGATDASDSNFIGQSAGHNATNATESNFFGRQSGEGAALAYNSNFIGLRAGRNSSGNNVNAFGTEAGQGNTLSGQTIFSNTSLPSYTNRAAATTAITVGNGATAGSTYMYYNASTFTIEAVRL